MVFVKANGVSQENNNASSRVSEVFVDIEPVEKPCSIEHMLRGCCVEGNINNDAMLIGEDGVCCGTPSCDGFDTGINVNVDIELKNDPAAIAVIVGRDVPAAAVIADDACHIAPSWWSSARHWIIPSCCVATVIACSVYLLAR